MKTRPEIDLTLPVNPTASHCLRKQELVCRINAYLTHDENCECQSCSWVKEQVQIANQIAKN